MTKDQVIKEMIDIVKTAEQILKDGGIPFTPIQELIDRGEIVVK